MVEDQALYQTFEDNPFRVTEQDEDDVFRLREEERKRRAKAREDSYHLRIWEKGRNGAMADRPGQRWLRDALSIKKCKADNCESNLPRSHHKADRIEECVKCFAPEERESMADYIAKKREMLLLQMSIDITKDEARKLKEKSQLKDDALRRSEQILEEDAVEFEEFLKDNDKRTRDALRVAEKETKKKMDKIQESKKLNQQIQVIQADIKIIQESLDECLSYKSFLDDLTPPEWVDIQVEVKRARQRKRRRERIAKRKKEWIKQQDAITQKAKENSDATTSEAGSRRRKAKKRTDDNIAPFSPPPEPDFEVEALTSSDEDLPMYFEKPDQLMSIFSTLEENNLLLIKINQEAGQSLEELEQDFADTKENMEEKASALEANIKQLKISVVHEVEKERELRDPASFSTCYSFEDDRLLHSLNSKVGEIYHNLGLNDAGSSPSTLFMLSDIEARMEKVLAAIGSMPEDYVKKAEKIKRKQRRELKRVLKQEAQEKAQEERNRKALERCMQPPKKREGKPVMYRSYLAREKKVEENKVERTQEVLDDLKHLT